MLLFLFFTCLSSMLLSVFYILSIFLFAIYKEPPKAIVFAYVCVRVFCFLFITQFYCHLLVCVLFCILFFPNLIITRFTVLPYYRHAKVVQIKNGDFSFLHYYVQARQTDESTTFTIQVKSFFIAFRFIYFCKILIYRTSPYYPNKSRNV